MKFLAIALMILALVPELLALRKSVCRVLALEGGGTKGAYQAGAFKAMAALMDPEEVKYDVIAGVSVGSLNGLLIAMYAPGTEKAASQGLSGLWANITQGDIFEHWPYVGPLKGLFAQGSFLDNSPLLATINKKFHEMGGVIHRKFTVGIVDAETAEYIVKDERGGHENMPQNIFASASVPGIFPSIITSDHMLVDGGVMDNINLRAAIKRCSEIVGDDDSAITVDVIMTNPVNTVYYDMSESTSYNVYSRASDLGKAANSMWYLNDNIRTHPKINWRYAVIPHSALPNYPYIALSFDPKVLQAEHDIGYKDAATLIKDSAPNFVDAIRRAVASAGYTRLPRRVKIN